jgi:AP endonuclease-1
LPSTSTSTQDALALADPDDVPEPTTTKKRKTKAKAIKPDPLPEDFAPRVVNDYKIGAHVSAAGGVENAIVNAAQIGCVSM